MQLNSLGAEALPVVEKAAAATASLSPERKRRLNQALLLLRPRAREIRLRSARREWLRKIFIDAYTTGGHTDPKWDTQARAAIDAYLTSSLNSTGNVQPLVAATFDACKAATDLGCDDPLIYTLYRLHAPGDIFSERTDKILFWSRVRRPEGAEIFEAVLLLWLDVDADRMKPSIGFVVSQDWSRRFEQIIKDRTTPSEHADFFEAPHVPSPEYRYRPRRARRSNVFDRIQANFRENGRHAFVRLRRRL